MIKENKNIYSVTGDELERMAGIKIPYIRINGKNAKSFVKAISKEKLDELDKEKIVVRYHRFGKDIKIKINGHYLGIYIRKNRKENS